RQPGRVALVLDELALLDVDVERVGEDVDRVEPDLLGHADAEGGVAAGLRPGRVDQAEFHGGMASLVYGSIVMKDAGRSPGGADARRSFSKDWSLSRRASEPPGQMCVTTP